MAPPLDIDRDAARDAAAAVLSDPIYPRQTPLQQLGDLVSRWVDELIGAGAGVPGGWFTVTVVVALLAAALVVAVRVARRTQRGGAPAAGAPLGDGGSLDAEAHRALADAAAARGAWGEAVVHRLRAVARHLEADGVLVATPGRTATELARDAGARLPHLAAALTRAATVFNDVVYGDTPADEADHAAVAAVDRQLGRAVAAAPPDTAAPSPGWAPL